MVCLSVITKPCQGRPRSAIGSKRFNENKIGRSPLLEATLHGLLILLLLLLLLLGPR